MSKSKPMSETENIRWMIFFIVIGSLSLLMSFVAFVGTFWMLENKLAVVMLFVWASIGTLMVKTIYQSVITIEAIKKNK